MHFARVDLPLDESSTCAFAIMLMSVKAAENANNDTGADCSSERYSRGVSPVIFSDKAMEVKWSELSEVFTIRPAHVQLGWIMISRRASVALSASSRGYSSRLRSTRPRCAAPSCASCVIAEFLRVFYRDVKPRRRELDFWLPRACEFFSFFLSTLRYANGRVKWIIKGFLPSMNLRSERVPCKIARHSRYSAIYSILRILYSCFLSPLENLSPKCVHKIIVLYNLRMKHIMNI